MNDVSKVVELRGPTFTIGRSPDCEFVLAHERVSGRHCQLSVKDGTWSVQDLRSTNRTFVNGTVLGAEPRRLSHGDLVRLGDADAALLEVRFVIVAERGHAAVALNIDDGPQRKIAELEAALRERDAELRARSAELVRMSEQVKKINGDRVQLHGERMAQATASQSAERASAVLTDEIASLRGDLADERTELKASRDAVTRGERRIAELEAQLASQDRQRRSEQADGKLQTKDLESRLRMAMSDLAVARDALATATANLDTLQKAYADALARLEAHGLGPPPRR